MRKKLCTIVTVIMLCLMLLPISASAKASPKQVYKAMKCIKSNSDVGYSVSMKKQSSRYVYTVKCKMKKISSGIVALSYIFAPEAMNDARKTMKSLDIQFYKVLKANGIKGDVILNVKSSDNKLIWRFKNGKQTYNYGF